MNTVPMVLTGYRSNCVFCKGFYHWLGICSFGNLSTGSWCAGCVGGKPYLNEFFNFCFISLQAVNSIY